MLCRSFQDLLKKQEGERAMWEYPFAVAGVNMAFMLIQMLDLEAENESPFDLLYCITFKLMDQKWLAMHASYMDFNAVMKSTWRQLERELLQDDVTRLEDLPSSRHLTR
ncbi:putative ELMO domain-containing protein [Helianthus anomalus]